MAVLEPVRVGSRYVTTPPSRARLLPAADGVHEIALEAPSVRRRRRRSRMLRSALLVACLLALAVASVLALAPSSASGPDDVVIQVPVDRPGAASQAENGQTGSR